MGNGLFPNQLPNSVTGSARDAASVCIFCSFFHPDLVVKCAPPAVACGGIPCHGTSELSVLSGSASGTIIGVQC